jgi:AraC-like DNA-binding protein
MENIIKELQNELRTRFFMDGENHPKISAVKVYRFTDERIEMPQTDNPYLYIVLDGMLRLYTPSGIMDYMAGQYSVSKIDTPLSGTVLAFSEQQDFLAISIEFFPSDIIHTILQLENELTERIMSEQLSEQEMTLSDSEVLQSVSRLFSVMNHQTFPSEFIRNNIMQEITYYVLCGSCGKQFIQSIAGIGQAEKIYQANSWIKKNFHNSFAVEDLAKRQNMSVSLFHQKFKSAVGMGPLQCQKRLRLTEARRLMLDESKNVTEASVEVGYESLSQFIRDYRRMFRAAPKEDILNIQKHLKK